jgi:aspartate aminotransferase
MGEPDFATSEHIKQAAIAAINDGYTKYTPIDGLAELKQAIIEKFARDNQLQYELNQIIVSTGAKQCIYNAFQVILNKGDEVIIPAPFWISYPEIVKLAAGTPKIVNTNIEQAFKITPEQLAKAITAKTRALILNSPNNPSGAVYSATELKALSEVLLRHPHIIIVSDDIYEHIRWSGDPFVNIANICPALQANTIVINGVSKAYAMTGWRIGYAAGPVTIIAAMKKIQSQSTSGANSIAQMAAIAALQGNQDCVTKMAKIFHQRHDLVVAELNTIDGLVCLPSEGTFYSFPYVGSDTEFCTQLLEKAGIALLPGLAFGLPGYLRLSYATSMEELTTALTRIKNFATL